MPLESLPFRCCGNLVWFLRALGKNERAERSTTLRRPLFDNEECKDASTDVDWTECGFHLTPLQEKEIATFFIYHVLSAVSATFDTLLLIVLPLFFCNNAETSTLPLYGTVVACYPLGQFLSFLWFTRATNSSFPLFSTARNTTAIASGLAVFCWALSLLVFLNLWSDETGATQAVLLLVSRLGLGAAGLQQFLPLLFCQHMSSVVYRQRDDLLHSFARHLLGPSIALIAALGLPPLTPDEFNPTLRSAQLFNIQTWPCWLGLGLAASLLAYSLQLVSNHGMGGANHHSAEHHLLFAHTRLGFNESSRVPLLWAEACLSFVFSGIGWTLLFQTNRSYPVSVFHVFPPIFVGWAVGVCVNPKTAAFLLRVERYRLPCCSYEAQCRASVLLGVLVQLGCCISLVLQSGSDASVFAPMALYGYALYLVSNSVDRLELPRRDSALSIAADTQARAVAKIVGRALGTFVSGSLLTRSGEGGCHLRQFEFLTALYCLLLVLAAACLYVPCAGVRPGHGARIPLGDPDCICASLALDSLDVVMDVDVV